MQSSAERRMTCVLLLFLFPFSAAVFGNLILWYSPASHPRLRTAVATVGTICEVSCLSGSLSAILNRW